MRSLSPRELVIKDDTWEPITTLPGSEHMIAEFQKHWEEEYKIKTTEDLQSVIDKRNTHNEKNVKTQHDRDTTVTWTSQGWLTVWFSHSSTRA